MRFKVIRFGYFILLFFVVLRLGYWQLFKGDELTARAEGQRIVSHEIEGNRGDILFSDGSILASTQPSYLVFAQPQVIKQNKKLTDNEYKIYLKGYAKELATIFWELDNPNGQPDEKIKQEQIEQLQNDLINKLSKNLYWISLGRKVNLETKEKLEKMNLTGLGFDQSSTRFYPEASSSAHLLGFVAGNAYGDENGYFGVEGFYDGELRGKKGLYVQERDALGLPILVGKFLSKQPKNGKTLVLNIDRTIQHFVEEKLQKGIEKYGAKGASAIVLDPKTGSVLAMASLPSYDPARTIDFPKENFKNPITADGYEPGSTFKVLVMAAAINEGLIKPDTKCDICSKPVELSGFTIRTWNNKYQPDATMEDVLVHSDNTGMVFISKKLGIDKMYDYIEKLGFGKVTAIDQQDEYSPDLRSKEEWREIDLATSSFGQGISVTALQVARAVAAIANGGKLMEPHIVSAIKDEHQTFKVLPRVLSQPISLETAKIMTEMMVQAVDKGESQFYKKKYGLADYRIAGKTGTAQIPVAGHYDPTKTIASFVGFAPADDPKFVMLVRYDRPSSSIYGSETAAPTFLEISKELFMYYGIVPKGQ